MIDPVTLAVIRGRLEQIVDEMDATLFRAAFSPVIAEARDESHRLYDAVTGDTIAMGKTGLPVFIGAMSHAARAAIKRAEADGGFEGRARGVDQRWLANDADLRPAGAAGGRPRRRPGDPRAIRHDDIRRPEPRGRVDEFGNLVVKPDA